MAKYSLYNGVVEKKTKNLKKLITGTITSIVIAGFFTVPVFAANTSGASNGIVRTAGTPSTTTLDACGYFGGVQTSTQSNIFTTPNGIVHDNEKGTWTGITNIDGSLVKSLGNVSGTYTQNTMTKDGVVSGTEEFHSARGDINQTYSYTTSYTNFNVSVTATGDLSFLASNTNGQCYVGPSPRL